MLGSAAILTIILGARVAGAARILGVFPVCSVSHQIVFRAVTTELARRGHELVVITTDPVNDPTLTNYTEIDISFLYDFYRKNYNFGDFKVHSVSAYDVMTTVFSTVFELCELMMEHDAVEKLISPNNTKDHFELVLLEMFGTPCTYPFAHRFSAPMIGITSMPPFAPDCDSVGIPDNPSYIPSHLLPFSDRMTFFERLYNTVYLLRVKRFFYNNLLPRHQELADRYFGSSFPKLEELHTKVSMVFAGYDNIFHHPRPEVPTVVHIGGLHITPEKPLPKDLQQFLDGASEGALYFSLGTNVRSDRLAGDKLRMFLDAFAELSGVRVLWKWESDSLPGCTDRIRIRKWMPQQDVLRHKNVKAFITQGGLQSTEEAIHMGVPIVGMPFFSDQDYNVRRITEKGIGVKLDVNDLSKEKILDALRKVMYDQSYRENMRRLSALIRDQPSTPMERVIWWTEYVLRHKGAAHLRTAAVDMPWYQLSLVDVACFLLLAALLIVLLLWCSCLLVWRLLRAIRVSEKFKTN